MLSRLCRNSLSPLLPPDLTPRVRHFQSGRAERLRRHRTFGASVRASAARTYKEQMRPCQGKCCFSFRLGKSPGRLSASYTCWQKEASPWFGLPDDNLGVYPMTGAILFGMAGLRRAHLKFDPRAKSTT